ncbi:uncharacterized protein LOC113470297 [Diaphorina citri]|uniref:Uncharacterized protein LOC113470297 n=1 Tax=Diaphorina citri TaxID=121845 RepID=A0A3Q0J7J6_DIACI|nr:uncharacterized protein LOC113470297 [Diaphorina citri]
MFTYFYTGLLMRNQTDRLIKEDSEIIEHNTSININNNRISAFPPNLLSPTFYSQGGLSLPVMSSLFIPNPHPYIQGKSSYSYLHNIVHSGPKFVTIRAKLTEL